MNASPRSAHGHPFTAAAVVGSFSLALVVLLRVAGLLKGADAGFREWFVAQGFAIDAGSMQPWWDFLLVMVVIYALVWMLFETPGTARRMLVLLTAMVLLLTVSPVLALWGVFWTPVGLLLGVGWGGFCALLWARQHPMPCDGSGETEAVPDRGKIVPMTREESAKKKDAKDASDTTRRRGRGRAKR